LSLTFPFVASACLGQSDVIHGLDPRIDLPGQGFSSEKEPDRILLADPFKVLISPSAALGSPIVSGSDSLDGKSSV
jgi:hypothetical protein